MKDHLTEIIVALVIFLIVSGMGFFAARWKRPIRNHVTHEPNWRPPRPHSSRWFMFCGRFHRAAKKPMPLTIKKMTSATMISVRWCFMRHPRDRRHLQRALHL